MRAFMAFLTVLLLCAWAFADGPFDTPTLLKTVEQDTYETKNHIHGKEIWFGRHATQEDNVWALRDTLGLYRGISGANTWGVDAADTVKVIGSSDTPVQAGKKYFDMHKIFISASSQTDLWKIRFVWSTTNFAAGLAAGNISETVVTVNSAAARFSPVQIMMPHLAAGTKVWAQVWNDTDNATLDFLVGIHEYDK
jgi:hypothetical protein